MRKNIVFAFLIAITLAIAAGCNQYVLLPYPVPGGSSTQSDNIYVISGDIGNVNLQNIINNYDGIKGESKESPTQIPVKEPLIIAKDFTFEAVELTPAATSGASLFAARSDENKELPIGINLSGSTDDITLTIRDSKISGFGYAIMSNKANGSKEDDPNSSVNPGSLTLIIENSDFSDCFKGLYATDIKDLTVTDSTFTNMGTDAFGEDVVTRSGSAIDINQMSAGGTIKITNSTFTNCGSDKGSTSGAIKIKVRGDIDDFATDTPATNVNGSLEEVIIKDCKFGTEAGGVANRADVVLGTSHYASTDDFEYDIQECNIENNAAKLLSVNGEKKVSDLDVENYDGIIGTGTDSVIIFDQSLELNKTFSFENITLDSGTTEIKNGESPLGIDLSESAKDIAFTIKNCTVQNFGYAISSNKATGKASAGGTVKDGSLTLIIENSDFSNCYKGLYATDIKNMRISDNSTFTNMGSGATGTGVIERSGSAIDVNQMSVGEIITITDSSFTNCGGEDGTTSGAIKVKVRGGSDDSAPDIPEITTPGALEKFIVRNCEFSNNRADVVIGTSGYKSTGEFDKEIQGCNLEDNSTSTTTD